MSTPLTDCVCAAKRCGQLSGKDVVDMETYLERIVAAVKARQNPDFVIIARTDARNATQFGGPKAGEEAFQEGVKRCVDVSLPRLLTLLNLV